MWFLDVRTDHAFKKVFGSEQSKDVLLPRKFGTLTESQRAKVRHAYAETLLFWADRVLTASTPDEVFED